jgi:hypothetical protein
MEDARGVRFPTLGSEKMARLSGIEPEGFARTTARRLARPLIGAMSEANAHEI